MGRLHDLWHLLTLPCAGMTELASRALDADLKPGERVALRVHLLTCVPCRRFADQIRAIGQALQRVGSDHDVDLVAGPGLPDDVRARIKLRLEHEE